MSDDRQESFTVEELEDEQMRDAEGADVEEQQPDTGGAESTEGAPISTRDGKHTIPYEVLAETRRQLQELKRQNEMLARQVAQSTQRQQQQQQQLNDLLAMDRDAFREYVSDKGIDALFELREQLKQTVRETARAYTTQALQRMSVEARQRVLHGVVADWSQDNKDLLANPVAAELVRAFDRALFAEKGIQSLDQLGPMRARKHLDEVAERVRRVLGALGQDAAKQPGEAAKADTTAAATVPSLEGVRGAGGAGGTKSLADMSGLELEMQMASMTPEEIEKLFEEE